MAEIIRLDEVRKRAEESFLRARRSSEIDDRRQTAQLAEGGHAWDRLRAHRKRIPRRDAEVLARRIDQLIGTLEVKPGVLATEAGLTSGTRELHRLRLPEKVDPAVRRVHTEPDKYVRLIRVLSRHSGEDIYRLVDRLAIGTSLHPRSGNATDIETLVAMMQEIVLEVDREAGLFDAFRQTTALRERSVAARRGLLWPYLDRDEDAEMYRPLTPNDLGWSKRQLESAGFRPGDMDRPIRLLDLSHLDEETRTAILESSAVVDQMIARYHNEYDDSREYWEPHCVEGEACHCALDWADAVKYLPHAFVGEMLEWQDWNIDPDEPSRSHEIARIRQTYSDQAAVPHVTEDPTTGELAMATLTPDRARSWLVVYPNRDASGLVPVLFVDDQDMGVELVPMTVPNLVRRARVEVHLEGRHLPLLERVKELLGYGVDSVPLLEAWRQTAAYLQRNPLLTRYLEEQRRERAFKEKVARFLARDGNEEDG